MKPEERKRFSFVARARSTVHAFRGLFIVFKTQHNAWVHAGVSIFAIVLGIIFSINTTEWCLLIFSIGFVVCMEAINTAIEIDMDLTSPEYHPFARDTKDAAAGAVLFSAFVALTIGCIIFIPKIISLIQ